MVRHRWWLVVVTGALAAPTACAPSSSDSTDTDAAAATPLPCDIEAATEVCRTCHTDPPSFGSPMPLVTWEDMHKPAPTDPSKTVYEMMGERIDSTTSPMPPSGTNLTLSAADKATLDAWIQAGAPATTVASCTDAGMGDGGTGGGVGPEYLPCTPSYTFKAHDPNDPSQGFTVPTGGTHNYYECFAFSAPFKAGEQGTAWAPIIDQTAVLHHWILWETPSTSQADGSVFPCGALPDSGAKFLMGWAPGGRNAVLPSNIGLHFDVGSTLLLQIHYWNPTDTTGLLDRSGVAVCTDSGRPMDAGIFATGPLSFTIDAHSTATFSATCSTSTMQKGLTDNGIADDSHFQILSDGPHMHKIGTKFSSVIHHSDGTSAVLVNVDPFDFNEQTGYPHDPPVNVDLTAGDSITTSCTYDNQTNSPVSWGERTEDEMCFDFIMAAPFPTTPTGGMLPCAW